MAKKKNVITSWTRKYAANQSANNLLDDINNYDNSLRNDIARSEENIRNIQRDIDTALYERKLFEEDPDGYYYYKRQKELESRELTWEDYKKNWYNAHGRRMNDFLIQDFLGYIDRTNLWSGLAQSLQESWDIEDRINVIYDLVNNLQNILPKSPADMAMIDDRIEKLQAERDQLLARRKLLEPDIEAFKSYIPGSLRSRYYDLVAGNGENFGFSNNAIFGRTTQAHDEMGDFLRHTATMFSPKRTREEQKQMLDRALKERDLKIKEWQRGIELNIRDREKYGKVDEYFLRKDINGTGNIFDKDTWLYQMPGLIAGSTSGASKIIPAMFTGAATALAIGATGGLGALAVGAIGGAATMGLNYGAGISENNSEIAYAYNERLENYLKSERGLSGSLYDDIIKEGRKKLNAPKSMTDELIFELYRRGDFAINNVRANKKMRLLAIGIENQHQDDMAAVAWTSLIETGLDIIPFGKVISVPRVVKYQMLKTAARREALRSGKALSMMANLQKGYEIGSVTSPVGGLIYAPLHLAVSPLLKKTGKVGKEILDDISRVASFADDVPSEVLGKHLISDTRRRYFKDLSGRFVLASAAESIEEGKQSISENRYKNGEYTSAKIKSIGETILDDFLAGSKSAGLLLGMPFEGLMSESDRKTLREMKGGLIVGGLQTGVVNVATSIAPYRSKQSVNKALVNSVLIDKARKVDRLNKSRIYAEAAKSQSAYQNMLDGFDRLKKQNQSEYESTGEYAIPQDLIDEEEKKFKDTVRIANDPYTIKQAKTQEIEAGTKEYNDFVAVKVLAQDELKEALDVLNAANENLKDISLDITMNALDQAVEESSVVLPSDKIDEDESKTNKPNVAEHTSIDNVERLQNIAMYSALLRRKQELEAGLLNAKHGKHGEIYNIITKILPSIDSQIKNLKPIIESYINEDERVDVNNLESVEKYLALDKQNHDKLTEAYRQSLVAEQDFELAYSLYEDVVGKVQLNGKDITPGLKVDWNKEYENITFKDGRAKSVIEQIQQTIDDDDDLSSVIEEDFDRHTDSEGNEIEVPEQEDEVPINDPDKDFVEGVEKDRKSYVLPMTTSSIADYSDVFNPTTSDKVVIKDGPKGWREDPNKANKTRRIYLKGKEEKGYFEIVKDEEPNNYSVHFKPKDGDKKTFTNSEKNELFRVLAEMIPEGGNVSTYGSVSKGGISGINRLANLGFEKTGYRDLKMKKTGEPVKVPVYTKTKQTSLAEDTQNIEQASPELVLPEHPNVEVGPDGALKPILKPSEPVSNVEPTTTPETQQTQPERPLIEELLPAELESLPPVPPTPPSAPTQSSEQPDAQRKTLETLKKRAELSKKYVKKVTPEYYLIEINGKSIKMPRVHSIMPEYWTDYGGFMPALQVGNAIDNLARIFFGDKNNVFLYETDKQALINKLANEYASHKDNPNDPSLNKLKKLYYRDLFNRPEEFEKTIDDLYNLFKEYQKLGWELSTEPIVWYSLFKSGWVAGETDMIAVDRDGNIHIIDFKTAKTEEGGLVDPFGRYTNKYGYSVSEQLQDRLLSLNESDFTIGPRGKGLSKEARKLARDIRKEKDSNKIIIVWNSYLKLAELRFITSDYSNIFYSEFRTVHKYNGKDKGSKEDEYSDQLTAYREMILRNLFNVVDMEVIGFRADYNYDGEGATADLTSINSVRNERYGKPFRIKVFDSEEMKYILNTEGDPVNGSVSETSTVELTQDAELVENDIEKKNEINDSTKLQEQQKTEQFLPKNPEPEVVSPGDALVLEHTEENEQMPSPKGHSNLNPNVVNTHPGLVNGAVYDPKFIDELISNGNVELYTELITDRNGTMPSLYADITYNGKTYKRIFIYADEGLLKKVQYLEKHKQPGQKIVATKMSRTSGKIRTGKTVPVASSGLVDEEISQLQFNSASGSFGYVKNGNVVTFVGKDVTNQTAIYSFVKNSPQDGILVYLKKLQRSESEGRDAIIPVTVKRKNLSKDGDFIINCLKNIDTLNMPHMININGKDVSIGATTKELLNILIPYIDDISANVSTYSIVRDDKVPSVFYIVDIDKKVLSSVDLKDETSVNEFKKSLSNFYIEELHLLLVSKINQPDSSEVFKKIYKFFANNKEGVKSLSISDSLNFDFEDFAQGLTGLGWYVKHGIFVTDYAGIDSPKISINDVAYSFKETSHVEPEKPNSIDTIGPEEGFSLDDFDIANWGEVDKTKTPNDSSKRLLTEADIKKHLRPILGDVVDDPAIINIVTTLSSDPKTITAQVVGKATASAITLYNAAFTGVDYHEAFHRIFELFVPENVRESVYKKTADILGVNLNESNKDNKYVGHRRVAEWLADKYMDFRKYNISTGIQWLDRIINFIIDNIRVLCSINNRDLYKLFLEINSGKYKNMRTASKLNVDRFNEIFGLLNYEIHSENFTHIVNDAMYEELKNCALFCLINGLNIDVSGSTIQNIEITPQAIKRGAERLKTKGFDVLGTGVNAENKTAAQLAMSELVIKFDAVADDLASMVANISTDYRKIMQLDGIEDADGGESQSSYDENFFKWSYEFDKFDKTTSRVKFFFATIPDLQFADDSHKTYKYATNSLGLPQFIPMNYVYNEVLSNLWDVDSIEEVVSRLSQLAIQDPMYAVILKNLMGVIRGRVNKDGTTNADNEALLAQLMTTIRSNRHTFMLLRAVSDPNGVYNILLLRSDADYNARVFPMQWSLVLAKGGSETLKVDKTGKIVFNPKNKHAVQTFSKIAKLFDQIKEAVAEYNNGVSEITIPEYDYSKYQIESSIGNKTLSYDIMPEDVLTDITDIKQCNRLKLAIVEAFNRIGINIHTEELDFMLRHKYGSSDFEAIKRMMTSTSTTDSIGSFIFFLNNIVKNGKLNIDDEGKFTNSKGKHISFDNVFSDMAFIRELGNWKYEYRHAHDQLTVLATGGNRFYEMSDNDYMSDVLRSCNKRGEMFEELKKDPYNYFVGDVDNFGLRHIYGSLTLKLLSENSNLKIALNHFIGFKTDKKGDEGADYFEISRREDYLSKVGILENDGMISLTLSDKKKYCYITGIKLPGIDYKKIRDNDDVLIDSELASLRILRPDTVASSVYNILQREDVVDQMISYAVSEYESILRNTFRLTDGTRKIANFDTAQQCVKFSSLLGIWEQTFDKDGIPNGELYISFNDANRSWEENLSLAEAYFFDRSIDELRAIMGRILTKRTEEELKTAEKLGLIEKVSNSANPFLNYKNVGLNNKVIASIKASYLASYKQLKESEAESLAVVMYINDISSKAIMSGQEMERLFSGNPAFYKWKYDKNGKLIDRTVDELKRLGGLGSTGINNFTELSGIPSKYLKNGKFTGKYRCAEVDNEMVSSPQYEQIKKSMYESQLRSLLIDDLTIEQILKKTAVHNAAIVLINKDENLTELEKIDSIKKENENFDKELQGVKESVCAEIDNSSIEDLETKYPEISKEANIKAKAVSDALSKDIDVADGGAYITDTMCEMLLRMEGAYSNDIQEAFKILRGEVKADYLGQIEAYLKVLTSVIGSLKYTAFGRRMLNGNSVPYYHKMALFPIFKCIATGKLGNIFDKMKEQGIDMLLVNSAVKVGSEGSKSIDWKQYREDDNPENENNFSQLGEDGWSWKPTFEDSFNFETYECLFDYLRKQLNTDPKEEQLLRMGTQMLKVVFSNLVAGRTYITQNGEQITGKNLLDRIMNSSNQLSNIGTDKVNKRFFVTDEDGNLLDIDGDIIVDETIDGEIIPARNSNKRVLDIEKFSKEVSKMMSDRGADKNIMKALEIVTTSAGKQLQIPLGAISNASWLESVLISSINKEIIDVNTPGAFYIQRSIWAMQGSRMYDKTRGSIKGRLLYNGKRLLMVNEEGSMDCVLSIDFFEHILPEIWTGEYETDEDGNYVYETDEDGNLKKKVYGEEYLTKPDLKTLLDFAKESGANFKEYNAALVISRISFRNRTSKQKDYLSEFEDKWTKRWLLEYKGDYVPKKIMRKMTFDEARQWLLDNGIIGGKSNIIAYRIPTLAESSIHALRCVDVLPVVRDTVILPEEFTKITGSDFDIDKLGLSTINWKITKDGVSDKFEEGSEKYYQNLIIRDYITLLIDSRTQHILHRSIDNDTKLLKDVLKEVEGSVTSEEQPYSFYSLSTQTERKDDYITGKIGIGPFALNNNNHILTMLYGVRFKKLPGSIMTALGLTDLSIRNDYEGNSILSWISALINAHVDIAKDPYISRLNVNQFTYNLVNTLIRTGFGKKTFYFTTLPIMKELAKAYNNAASSYMADQYKSQYQLQKEAVEETAKKYFGDLKLLDWTFDEIVEGLSNPEDKIYKPTINKLIKKVFDGSALKNNANKEMDNVSGAEGLSGELVLMLMYFAYLQFNPYALSVSNLVKYSKIDTKKHGKSYIELQLYQEGFNDLFYNKNGGGLFEEDGLRKMAEDSYIALKTNNAISMTKNILKGQFLLATNAFDNAVKQVLCMIGKPDSKNVDLYKKISLIIMASIKSEFINEYASDIEPEDKQYIRDLVTESEENLTYEQSSQSNRLKITNKPRHDLKSYVGSKAYVTFEHDGTVYDFVYTILGYDDKTKELIVDTKRKVDNSGKIHIVGGKNTIYDRFLSLVTELIDDPAYNDVLDNAGEPTNLLLRSLVLGKTFEYKSPMSTGISYLKNESEDTYPTLKFIKLFNALDQNGIESNRIIDAWDELLHDNKHPKLKKFAEDLVVYAFVTSGDQGGFTKFFKQVPLSWRLESGYADFIRRKLSDYQYEDIPTDQLQDAILNNWFEGQLVPKYELYDKEDKSPNFISYSGERLSTGYRAEIPYPIILAALKDNDGVLKPSIDPENAPLFIKVPRRKDFSAIDSQRRVTVYKLASYGMRKSTKGDWVHYPIYVKIEPKGNQLKGNYLITEYGREDSLHKEYAPSEEALKAMYLIGDFIADSVVDEYATKWGAKYAQMIEDMNYRDLFVNTYNGSQSKFNDALENRKTLNDVTQNETITESNPSAPTSYEGTITPKAIIQGENIASNGSEFAKKLTNPGNNLQVEYKGKTFRNAEHAYLTWKSGEFDEVAYNSTAFKPKGSKPVNKQTNYLTMVDILKAKLQQHPELVEGITHRGGEAYLKASTHNITGDKYWESTGQNKFIEALTEAYNVINQQDNLSSLSAQQDVTLNIIYELIENELSYDSALQILKLNNYNVEQTNVQEALGKLIKKLCGGK